jgi:hypothetical protein
MRGAQQGALRSRAALLSMQPLRRPMTSPCAGQPHAGYRTTCGRGVKRTQMCGMGVFDTQPGPTAVVFRLSQKRADTVGQPPGATNHALNMPLLKAQKSLESNAATAAVWRGNRLTNSIRTISVLMCYQHFANYSTFGYS